MSRVGSFFTRKRLLNNYIYNLNFLNYRQINPLRVSSIAHKSTSSEKDRDNETVHVHFDDGFFKFKIDSNQFIVSFWTPLRDLTKAIQEEIGDKSSLELVKVLENHSKEDIPSTQPIGETLCLHQKFLLDIPKADLYKFIYKGSLDEIFHWKETAKHGIACAAQDLHVLQKEKDALLLTYSLMEKDFHKILYDVRRHTSSKFRWGGLFLLSAQLGFVGRLTWFEYSWDIMEPITWCLTYSTIIASFAYYNVTSQEYLLPQVEKRLLKDRFNRIAQKQNFDVDAFKTLRKRLLNLDEKILSLETQKSVVQ